MRCIRCGKEYDRPANNYDGLVTPRGATPAARPVRVGDELCISNHPDRPQTGRLVELHEERGRLDTGVLRRGLALCWVYWEDLTHADGAPIDVAASLEIAKSPASVTTGMVRLDGPMPYSEKLAVSEALDRAAKLIAELGEKLAATERGNTLYADLNAGLMRSNTSLADKAGALATELRDAHATIGRQQQTIERLERDAKRRR